MRKGNARRWLPAAALLIWATAVVTGTVVLVDYAARPGPSGAAPESWPTALPLELDPRRPTLVMVAHPRCPCTAASIEQLARLMAGAQDKVRAYVVLSGVGTTSGGWAGPDLQGQASRIPGVTVVDDATGSTAGVLGVATSGHVLLFGPDGQRRFSGGITAARGHVGDNFGDDLVRAAISDPSSAPPQASPVYGCAVRGGKS